jgi:3-hydroxy-9,10-secoandrosta-1,3,5(10)-triene-9,17-dione monooxygenase reductase component
MSPGRQRQSEGMHMANSPALAVVDDVDARHFRDVLGLFATGVVAVTAVDAATGRPAGLSANSFTSVSLDPPLVSVCLAHTSTTWPRIRAAGRCAINILSEHQRGICLRLAAHGGDKFCGLAWTASPAGHPVLDGALGWLDCILEAEHWAGDHVIAICRVEGLDMIHEGRPLIFYRGSYGGFAAVQQPRS